jgi:NAD dependent epimerase/dehydratase family enzyme
LRTETELIIKSRRVIPERLTKSGFIFNYPSLGMSLENLQKVKRLND